MSLQEGRWLTCLRTLVSIYLVIPLPEPPVSFIHAHGPHGFSGCPQQLPSSPPLAISCHGAHCLDSKEGKILCDQLWCRVSEHFRKCFFLSHVWRVLLVVRCHDNGQLLSRSPRGAGTGGSLQLASSGPHQTPVSRRPPLSSCSQPGPPWLRCQAAAASPGWAASDLLWFLFVSFAPVSPRHPGGAQPAARPWQASIFPSQRLLTSPSSCPHGASSEATGTDEARPASCSWV